MIEVIHKDSEADIAIRKAIQSEQNFSVVAGAGSGKTGSLIKALLCVKEIHGPSLRKSGSRVACITFTNTAVDVIRRRAGADDLFQVTTIHAFLWGLISSYHQDMQDALKNEIIPKRIAKKAEDDNGGTSIRARAARAQLARLKDGLARIDENRQVAYDSSGRRNYAKGQIDHDDVIDLASFLISTHEGMRKVLRQKYPFIFVDEAQDTFLPVMEAMNAVAGLPGLPVLGYFGDPVQQIYEDRTGDFFGPLGTILIKKSENYRCSKEVIKVLNRLRTDIEQKPGGENLDGSVSIILIKTEDGRGPRRTYDAGQLAEVRAKFDKAVEELGWSQDPEVKQLFLTRQMIAHRQGFATLNKLFTGPYASRAAEDDFKEGKHFLLIPFIDILVPLLEAKRAGNDGQILRILRENSPLLDPDGINRVTSVREVANQINSALDGILEIWGSGNVKDTLLRAEKFKLFTPSQRLGEHLTRKRREEVYEEGNFSAERADWLADDFFSMKVEEIAKYRDFVFNLTPYRTQHGVKGDEFDKVLVVFDDTEANWNLYSFSRLFTPATVGSVPTEGQQKKSSNLAYVCFSRAVRDLRVILFSKDVANAKLELIASGLFLDAQINILA